MKLVLEQAQLLCAGSVERYSTEAINPLSC